MQINEENIKAALESVSPRTRARIKRELARGDYHRIANILEYRILPPPEAQSNHREFSRSNQAHSYRTELRRVNDLRHGRTTADRPDFVAWDGEGRESDGKHRYTLLANSRGKFIENTDGLGTRELLAFMVRNALPRTVNIFYSFGYDVQQIVADLSDGQIKLLMHGEPVYYEGFKLQYFAGKIFTINNWIRFYDIFSFFHTSFVKSIAGMLGKEFITPELVAGKEARSDFNEWTLEKIRKYNDIELDLLQKLGSRLREIFDEADIQLRNSYYGPGAIARFWFRKHRIKPIKIQDAELADTFERAYYGGRFETFILGQQYPVFEYDLHSAYPAAIAELRLLDNWTLYGPDQYNLSSQFSVWRVEWHLPKDTRIGPFPSRDRNGLISYPANGIGWYYKPELEAALRLYPRGITILAGYNPEYISEDSPFDWVEKVYDRRAELKEQGNPAQWALKVGLNSLYGKTAQRVGSNTFFCLPWAGWITSKTRAKLLNAIHGRINSIIAYATDAVYSTEKLPSLDIGESLGQWEYKEWKEGIFIQSGVYRLIGESTKDAYRGFHSTDGLQPIFDQIRENPLANPSITQTRFVTHLEAINFPKAMGPHRLKFIQIRKVVQPYRPTKRIIANHVDVYQVKMIAPEDIEILGEPLWIWKKISDRQWIVVYPDYALLLNSKVETRILENMNDHRDPFYTHIRELGPFEESYPFRKLLSGQEKELNGEPDQIAEDRLGGVRGNIPTRDDPIVDESQILMEIKH